MNAPPPSTACFVSATASLCNWPAEEEDVKEGDEIEAEEEEEEGDEEDEEEEEEEEPEPPKKKARGGGAAAKKAQAAGGAKGGKATAAKGAPCSCPGVWEVFKHQKVPTSIFR